VEGFKAKGKAFRTSDDNRTKHFPCFHEALEISGKGIFGSGFFKKQNLNFFFHYSLRFQ